MTYRAEARVAQFRRLTVEERYEAFRRLGYRPHGHFEPYDDALREEVRDRLRRIGTIEDVDRRLSEYYAFQDWTASLEKDGVPGRWIGQHAVARCDAQYRIVAWGRRSGKTIHAAYEAAAVAILVPRSTVWIAAPTMEHVSRCFDVVRRILTDAGYSFSASRDTRGEKLLIIDGLESRIVGLSLHNPKTAAGMAVDFVVVDEAAQVTEAAWERAVVPTLADRRGSALLISTFEGEDNFFFKKVQEAQENAGEGIGAWRLFVSPTWEVNFYQFPQGRRSPALISAEKTMSPETFLEQFGSIPRRKSGLVYPEFRERVHVGNFAFDPHRPVILAVDPSAGANPYVVVAIQEHGNISVVIDEFYERYMTVEEIVPILNRKPWRSNVTDVVVDAAQPAEIERWARLGWPAYPVPERPKVKDRIPIYRTLLRDPVRFHEFRKRKMDALVRDMGYPSDVTFEDVPVEMQAALSIQLEELLSDFNMTDDDVSELRQCASIFFCRHCVNAIREHRLYVYGKATYRKGVREEPIDRNNDCLDALGYYAWTFRRFSGARSNPATSYIDVVGRRRETSEFSSSSEREEVPVDNRDRAGTYVSIVRHLFGQDREVKSRERDFVAVVTPWSR